MKNGVSRRPGVGPPWSWWPFLAVAVLLVGFAAGDAFAQSGFEVNKTLDEAKGIGTILLALVFLAYLVVAGIVILSALASARERGQWSHFLIALGAVVVAGFVLWSLTAMTGHSPQKITEKIQIK
jgi:uncharacterized membrane protein YjgN (DUF898 family)